MTIALDKLVDVYNRLSAHMPSIHINQQLTQEGVDAVKSFATEPGFEILNVVDSDTEGELFVEATTALWHELEKRLLVGTNRSANGNIIWAIAQILQKVNDSALIHRFDQIESALLSVLGRINEGKLTQGEGGEQASNIVKKIFVTAENPWARQTSEISVLKERVFDLRKYRAVLINNLTSVTRVRPGTIVLDYDGAVSTDPEYWKKFAKMSRDNGHLVYLVTLGFTSELTTRRDNGLTLQEEWGYLVEGIICTGEAAKRKYCRVNHSLKPDVWIDSNPFSIYEAAKLTRRKSWREMRDEKRQQATTNLKD